MPDRFLEPLDVRSVDGRTWRVLHGFAYRTDVDRGYGALASWVITIPVDFETDFASVPRLLQVLFPPTGTYGKAAVLHDYLYRTPGVASRDEADLVFKEAMKALGTGWFTRQCLYHGVRLFGGRSYRGGL